MTGCLRLRERRVSPELRTHYARGLCLRFGPGGLTFSTPRTIEPLTRSRPPAALCAGGKRRGRGPTVTCRREIGLPGKHMIAVATATKSPQSHGAFIVGSIASCAGGTTANAPPATCLPPMLQCHPRDSPPLYDLPGAVHWPRWRTVHHSGIV